MYKVKKTIEGEGIDIFNAVKECSKSLINKCLLIKVVDIKKRAVSKICPELDYTSSAVLMLYDWIGDSKPTMEEIVNLEFKCFVEDVHWVKYDFGTMSKLEEPFLEVNFYSTFVLGEDSWLKKGDLCDIEIIGNKPENENNIIKICEKYPKEISLNAAFNYILFESFANYDNLKYI